MQKQIDQTSYRRPAIWAAAALLVGLCLLLSAHSSHGGSAHKTAYLSQAAAPFFPHKLPVRKSAQGTLPTTKKTIPPTGTGLTYANCAGKTIMNVVAHEDDDLLFINPTISNDLKQNDCIRTVYMTAGDDGRGVSYLKLREKGAEAAYDTMLHNTNPWVYQQMSLLPGELATVAHPQGNTAVSLTFLRLPDGNLAGQGFAATKHESLARLWNGSLPAITSMNGHASYTSAQLTTLLSHLMEIYDPQQINTQADDSTAQIADHSDHITTGKYVAAAARIYGASTGVNTAKLIQYFMGYPIRGLAANLNAAAVKQKAAAFFAYAPYDTGVCTAMSDCTATASSYGYYLLRQYVYGRR